MTVNVVVPELGESVLEATIAHWLKNEGDRVTVGDPLVELETDKVNLEVAARQSGILKRIERKEQEDVKVGDVIGVIEEADQPVPGGTDAPALSGGGAAVEAPVPGKAETAVEKPAQSEVEAAKQSEAEVSHPPVTPLAQRLAEERHIDVSQVPGSGPGGRVTKTDVEAYLQKTPAAVPSDGGKTPPPAAVTREEKTAVSGIEVPALSGVRAAGEASAPSGVRAAGEAPAPSGGRAVVEAPAPGRTAIEIPLAPLTERREERIKMTRRRRTIAQRLVEVHQTAAMLTTFNEADMTRVMELRKQRNEAFQARYGVKLGITSFFVKAAVGALKAFPLLNAEVQGDEMLVKYYYDIGVAVGSPEGLVVPVLRDADRLSFAGIEAKIAEFVRKTDEGKLTLDDLRGGTFSITNGGVFGSLMSTHILTPPQVGILGLHKIEKRPVVMDDQVVIRPMMYLALSYDHRIVDGREAVQFLVRIKELIEDPESLLLEG